MNNISSLKVDKVKFIMYNSASWGVVLYKSTDNSILTKKSIIYYIPYELMIKFKRVYTDWRMHVNS